MQPTRGQGPPTRYDPAAAEHALEDHGRVITTNLRAAGWYRQAQRTADSGRAAIALKQAIKADPGFELAIADLDGITGTSNDRTPRSQMSWERHHIEVVQAAAKGEAIRAVDLLREHLAGVGCDPLAFRIAAELGQSTARQGYADLATQLPDCHIATFRASPDR